ncbi:U-box domain-containing protein 18-like [Nicotiana tomentosiformis]|uniref:RING-type E3 ubiquitin transferase n=1 Tax=Nicotiana tabacum TaxID=4097 RepID=A0A1S3ZP45_TOBAC|nr:U-box domain-containing protein 18-like [Nicotiana tomentosiformis]XP_016466156.1 PREDICTED: U-box domain-containing protein 18-like [Nicotiana tabacum]
MINKSNEFTRRILNFPAIRPSETVSFSSLVTSLIQLGQTICEYKSRTSFTNKKNARNSIRLVENILIVLKEIPNGVSRFAESSILSLSEIHFIFQKFQFLLEDCTREDTRIWILAKSEVVSSQFQMLARAIAVALDVLLLEEMDVCLEVKEVVEFVRNQAVKLRFEVEVDDRRMRVNVLKILDQLEAGMVPESSDLKRVLDYLGIKRWGECNREVKFLDTEIGLEGNTMEKRDMGLLSSLMGFMIYCRGTLFEVLDNATTRQNDGGNNNGDQIIRFLNFDDLRCPITLEIMSDPVTIASGHTYDRSSILKWFRAGNSTCPKTGERLMSIDLVPNLALKLLIKQHCSMNGIPFVETGRRNRDNIKLVATSSVTTEQVMKLLASFLVGRLIAGSMEQKNKAAFEIRLLTKTSIFNRSCLVEAGATPPLLNLVTSRDSSYQENAMAALLNLAKNSTSKRILVENGGLFLILDVLKKGIKSEARQHAAGTLFYLTSVEEYRKMIGENPQAIPSLLELLRNGADRGKKNALVTIFGLLMRPENHWRVIAAGLVPLLVNLLKSFEREDLITDSLAVLSSLCERLDGAMAVLYAGALPIIIDVLNSCNSRTAKEHCVSLLLALCINGGADAVPVLVKNSSLMGPLYSLLAEGTSKASKKASTLIRMLHQYNEKTTSGLITPVFIEDQFINVW